LTLGTGDKCVIYLNVRRLAHYKPPLSRAIIAHEWRTFLRAFRRRHQAEELRQSEADAQAQRWGFVKAHYELNERHARNRYHRNKDENSPFREAPDGTIYTVTVQFDDGTSQYGVVVGTHVQP